ncbi:MAG: hypothetical protein IID34_04415 [Planctomycetes bacterium]|nr:hypothetical protein [Planctomycetota bacterium]
MLRKTLTILSLTGLLLSVGLWGVSYHLRPRFGWSTQNATHTCISSRGAMIFVTYGSKSPSVLGWAFLGFDQQGYETFMKPEVSIPWGSAALRVIAPLWIPTVLFLAYSLYLIPGARRRQRKKLGLCIKCGYDLRASKERCPECGEAIG